MEQSIMQTITNEIKWLKGPEAARYAGISRRQLTNWMQSGLPVKHLSPRHILIKTTDVDRFIETRSAEYVARAGIGG
jgi:hypothetical protein